MTNKQRRFLKKLYRMNVMSFDYLDAKYPDRLYDKELGAKSFYVYYEPAPKNAGITISVEGIEELQDYKRYLTRWKVPVILSVISISLTILLPVISLLMK